MIFKNCTFYNELFEKEFGDIETENGKITNIGIIDGDGIDMSGKIILPGFVDIHIHGGNGGDASDGSLDSLEKMSSYLAKNGVTSFCPTTMTLPVERLIEIAGIIAEFKYNQKKGSRVLGINFEGPFISVDRRGAQKAEYVVAPRWRDFDDLYDASGKLMKILTIAPEAFDSDNFIRCASSEITVSIGHTCATAEECQKAIDCGARHITHLYNAMTPMTHREAGVVGAALDNAVTCELICDLEHICPTVLRNTFKILGEDRVVVVSDSMRGAGLGVGEFELGGQAVFVNEGDGVARLADGTIAASITNLFTEFRNLLNIGIDFKSALKACTINPSRVIGEDKNVGSIAVGKYADLIICDENLDIKEVYINGALA